MKKNSLYLYLTIICFVGIILIFVFDGYVGIYDSLKMDNGRYPQTVEYDQWVDYNYSYARAGNAERGDRLEFTYTVENHRFSAYTAEASIFFTRNDAVIAPSPPPVALAAPAFGKAEAKWVIADVSELVPADYPEDQSYNLTVVISRGAVQREVNLSISGLPAKIAPVPAR